MKPFLFLYLALLFSMPVNAQIRTGAEQTELYIPLLQEKKIGLVANHTSIIENTHLLDSLLKLNINVIKIFSPEHGFRGDEEAGAIIASGKDLKTGLPIISLHGKSKKPAKTDLSDIDILVFDLQDVGTRFYTYISTLHYVMEAAAENNIEVIILDRPNPNAFYVDGPVLDTSLRSFVGMHPIPIVYGLTMGEYGMMINGEQWLPNELQCRLKIIPLKNYTHADLYTLPQAPSPNLQTMNAVYLYPSLCWFEGTSISVGRGTPTPFEIIGSPNYNNKAFSFTPKPIKGVSENPPFKTTLCYGIDLNEKGFTVLKKKQIDISYLIKMYKNNSNNNTFFQPFFDKLSGTKLLKEQIQKGIPEDEIRKSWQAGLSAYKEIRKKYLLYND